MSDIYTDDTLTKDLLLLRAVSRNVEDYVVNQVYISNYGPDDYSDETILRDAYGIIAQELQELGIYVEVQATDLYSLKYYYDFRKVFDGQYLDYLVKNVPGFKDYIVDLLSNTDEGDDILNDLIEYLKDALPNNPMVDNVYEKMLECTSTDAFAKHLESVIDGTIKECQFGDVVETGNYIQKISDGRIYFQMAVDKLYKVAPHLDMDYMDVQIQHYDLDKLNIDSIRYFAIFDKEDMRTIPDAVRPMAIRYMDMHHKRNKHHIEYWTARPDTEIKEEDLAMLVAHHYEPNKHELQFRADVDEMIKTGVDRLSMDQVQLINEMSKWLYDHK